MTHRSNLCKWFEERKKFGMNGNFGNFLSFVMSKTPKNSVDLLRRLACIYLFDSIALEKQLILSIWALSYELNLSSGLASSDDLTEAKSNQSSPIVNLKTPGPVKNVIWIINTSICLCFLVIKTIPDIPCDVSLSYFPWNIIK